MKTVEATANVLEYMRLHQRGRVDLSVKRGGGFSAKRKKRQPHQSECRSATKFVVAIRIHEKMVEDLCASYANSFNLSVAIIRFFSLYGPGLQKQLLWDACNKFSGQTDRVEFFGTGERKPGIGSM